MDPRFQHIGVALATGRGRGQIYWVQGAARRAEACRRAGTAADPGTTGSSNIRRIRAWMEAAGYAGFSEVEIFSARNWWQRPGEEDRAPALKRHKTVV